MRKSALIICFLSCLKLSAGSQEALIEGYIFEDGSPNYLEGVILNIYDEESGNEIARLNSEMDGYFQFRVPFNTKCRINSKLKYFKDEVVLFNVKDENKTFLRIGMQRQKGYLLTLNLHEKSDRQTSSLQEVLGASISVINNTSQELTYENKFLQRNIFSVPLVSENHYTIRIEKSGYLSKEIEAFVDKDGCVLCLEGIDKVQLIPNDSVRHGLSKGVLLADVELLIATEGQEITLTKVKFEKGSSTLNSQAIAGLADFANYLNANPQMQFEIAAYTDVRGSESKNIKETSEQAENIFRYLSENLGVNPAQLKPVGYGSSELVNSCKSGLSCTELQHSENRRIVARILDLGVMEHKDLASKTDIEIEKGVDYPSDSLVFKQKPRTSTKPNSKVLADIQDEEALEVFKDTAVGSPNDWIKTETIIEIVNLAEALKNDKKGKIEEVLELKTVDILEDQANELSPEQESNAIKTSSEDTNERIQVEETGGNLKELRETLLTDDANLFYKFSGYKIVVHFSNFPISANHPIYMRYNDISIFKTRQGNILYLTGEFAELSKAEQALEDIKSIDLNAYIVRFLNGKKTKIDR